MITHHYYARAGNSASLPSRAKAVFLWGFWAGLGTGLAIAAVLVLALLILSGQRDRAAREAARIDAERAASDQMADEIAHHSR